MRMNDGQKQIRAFYGSDRVPAFFSFLDSFDKHKTVRIFKDERGRFERDTVLALVALILLFIPLEPHLFHYTEFPHSASRWPSDSPSRDRTQHDQRLAPLPHRFRQLVIHRVVR